MATKRRSTPPLPKPPPPTAVDDGPLNEHLQAIVTHAGKDLAAALRANEVQILKDMDRIKDEKSEEGSPTFKIALGITFDLEKLLVTTAVTHSVKTTTKTAHRLGPDDGTPDMFGQDD